MPPANERVRPGRHHRAPSALVVLACLLVVPVLRAGEVQRCEDAAGRVTYSNEACPPGTKKSRAVDTSQPVQTDARGAPPERKDAPRAVHVQRTPAPAQAVAVDKDAMCQELARRVGYARRDLETASPQQRASAELAMRRVQDEFDLECKTQ